MQALRLALAVAVLAVSSICFMGCGHKSGREVYSWEEYNLKVRNTHRCRIHVHLDGGHLGSVEAHDTDYFRVKTGTYELSLIPAGLLGEPHDLGEISFTRHEVVKVTY